MPVAARVPLPIPKLLLTPAETAAILSISVDLLAEIPEDELPCRMVTPNAPRYALTDVLAYLDLLPTRGAVRSVVDQHAGGDAAELAAALRAIHALPTRPRVRRRRAA